MVAKARCDDCGSVVPPPVPSGVDPAERAAAIFALKKRYQRLSRELEAVVNELAQLGESLDD